MPMCLLITVTQADGVASFPIIANAKMRKSVDVPTPTINCSSLEVT